MLQSSLFDSNNKVIVADGANGTMLLEYLERGQCPEELNIKNPRVVRQVHAAYVKAGVDMVKTNTFGATGFKLEKHGLHTRKKEIVQNAVILAKEAAEGKAFVGLTVGPTGEMMKPFGSLDFQTAYETFKEQISYGMEIGVDFVDVQTMSNLNELRAVFIAARDLEIPISTSMTFEENGKSLMGTCAVTYARTVNNWGAEIADINCVAPEAGLMLIKGLVKEYDGPCYIRANAGRPVVRDGKTMYVMTPEEFLQWNKQYMEEGVRVLGGCCGTTPAHIGAIASYAKDKLVPIVEKNKGRWIGSAVGTLAVDEIVDQYHDLSLLELAHDTLDPASILGEIKSKGIEPSKALLLDFAGIPSPNCADIVQYLQAGLRNPLVFKSKDRAVLEQCIMVYGGIAGIMCGELPKEEVETIVRRYGGVVLG